MFTSLRLGTVCLLFLGIFLNSNAQNLNVKSEIRHVRCANDSNGKIKLYVKGGHPPYQYEWSDGSAHDNIVNKKAGTYHCVITDSQLNKVRKTFRIEDSGLFNVSYNVTSEDGIPFITFRMDGGSQPYSVKYLRDNGDYGEFNTIAQNQMASGVYNIYVSDGRGCVKKLIVEN